MAAHVLIVDDDPAACRHAEEIIRNLGHRAESVHGGEAALQRLTRSDAPTVSVLLLDMVMPDLDGMAVLERLTRHALAVPVIALTGPNGADAGADAMRAGALDFLVKPLAPERLRASLANALRIGALESEVLRMRLSRSGTLELADVLTRAPAMERLHRLSEQAARSPIPVLIEGERGVGKEVLARAIHGSGPRRSRPFVTFSCTSVRPEDAETVLFGSDESESEAGGEQGGESGGKIGQASGGTLFLEEIGALPFAVQTRLSRLLARQEARASADGRPRRGDMRLIATTSERRLVDLVSEDGFQEELFYRLNVFPIWLPPLRERRADIPDLARHLLARLASECGRSFVSGLSVAAMELLVADDWPGNISELERTIFRAVMLCEGSELTPHDFPLIQARNAGPGAVGRPAQALQNLGLSAGVAVQEQVPGEPSSPSAPLTDRRSPTRYGVARLLDERGELRPIEVLEAEVIRFAIGHYDGRMSEAARRLGIGRSTLYRKIRDYGIASDEPVAT